MIDPLVEAYSTELKALNIEHTILEHPALVDAREVQKLFGLTVADACPTLIMKADDQFVAIVKRGDCRLDNKKIKAILNTSSLRMATKEEFEELTKLPIGTARVLVPGVKTLLDQKLFEKEYLNGGTGSLTCTFKYRTEDLKKLPNSTVVDLAE